MRFWNLLSKKTTAGLLILVDFEKASDSVFCDLQKSLIYFNFGDSIRK